MSLTGVFSCFYLHLSNQFLENENGSKFAKRLCDLWLDFKDALYISPNLVTPSGYVLIIKIWIFFTFLVEYKMYLQRKYILPLHTYYILILCNIIFQCILVSQSVSQSVSQHKKLKTFAVLVYEHVYIIWSC